MTALLAWSVSGPPGTAAGDNETSTPRPRGVPHGALARNLASSKFREQRGVFIARGISVGNTDNGCAWEEPEPLAHKLPTSATTFARPATLRSLCDSGGGGRRHRGSGEPRSGEDGKRVAASRTFDIADHGGLGARAAVPGTSPARRSSTRDKPGARGETVAERGQVAAAVTASLARRVRVRHHRPRRDRGTYREPR